MKKIKFILLNLIIFILIYIANKFNFLDYIIKYIAFDDTLPCSFKDLLSILSSILSVFLGFMITVVTLFISMCDKRIMNIIRNFNKTDNLIKIIKNSIIYGFVTLFCVATIYINADFNILVIRYVLILIAINTMAVFITNSFMLISTLNRILIDSFNGNENLVVESEFKPKK